MGECTQPSQLEIVERHVHPGGRSLCCKAKTPGRACETEAKVDPRDLKRRWARQPGNSSNHPAVEETANQSFLSSGKAAGSKCVRERRSSQVALIALSSWV
jgi:hypothetical protein